MGIADRIVKYQAIEKYRGRPIIVYVTSTRANVPAMIAGDSVREFIDQVDKIPRDQKSVDVLIHSAGGDALAAWKLMSVLRERFTSVTVIVPFMAFSAATIFALGADEIVLHPHSSLGPIDPQITMTTPDGKHRHFAFEDVGAFLRFVKDEIGITEQSHIGPIVDKLLSVADPINVGAAKRASELSTDVGERLLRMHMKTSEEKSKARSIAEGLNKSFFAHGDAVSRTRARDLKLKVAKDDEKLEALIWEAYMVIEADLLLRQTFDPLQHFLNNGGAQSLIPPSPLILPPNTQPNVANQIWNQVAQQALQNMTQPGLRVLFTVINSIVESARIASEHRTEGNLSATMMMGGEIKLSAVNHRMGWTPVAIPTPPSQAQAAAVPST